jgi:histidinol-phosphatase (PHP family)
MFDYHVHTAISFDSSASPHDMIAAAERAGLREICFTDHYDYHSGPTAPADLFTIKDYRAAYEGLSSPTVAIRRGVEMGLTLETRKQAEDFARSYPFDFVLGSVHYVDGMDPYFAEFWQARTVREAFERYLEQTLLCVRLHDDFDVLGHLTYVCKSVHNPSKAPVFYEDFPSLTDDILRVLVRRGKGMEINASGVDRTGDFLPSARFLQKFFDLGGRIVTVGSDAHAPDRVGQYADRALAIAKDIFGHVCTFTQRTPVFHQL